MLRYSPNAKLNKQLLNRYTSLPLPDGAIIATYIWIDGTGEGVRCKDRTLNFTPSSPQGETFDLSTFLPPSLMERVREICYRLMTQ